MYTEDNSFIIRSGISKYLISILTEHDQFPIVKKIIDLEIRNLAPTIISHL